MAFGRVQRCLLFVFDGPRLGPRLGLRLEHLADVDQILVRAGSQRGGQQAIAQGRKFRPVFLRFAQVLSAAGHMLINLLVLLGHALQQRCGLHEVVRYVLLVVLELGFELAGRATAARLALTHHGRLITEPGPQQDKHNAPQNRQKDIHHPLPPS